MVNDHERKLRITAGTQALNRGDFASAIAAFERVLALAPQDAEALYLMGVCLLNTGDAANAAIRLERAARKLRNESAVAASLAQAYFALGKYTDAYAAFRNASRLNPKEVQYQLGTAAALAMQRRFDEAEALLRRMTLRFADHPLVWFNLGNALRDQERFVEAIECYRRALAIEPRLVDARNNLANALQSLRRLDEAEAELRACLKLAPDFALAGCNLASVLIDLGRFTEAQTVALEMTAKAPRLALSHAMLGNAYSHQGRLTAALSLHAHAANLAPGDAKIMEAYASSLADSGRFHEAVECFARARELNPGSFSTRWKFCLALLRHGSFAEGWRAYRDRPHPAELAEFGVNDRLPDAVPQFAGNRVCVLREQGLGDEIFFLRFVPLLAASGAKVIYRSSTKIHALIRRCADIDHVIAEGEALPPSDIAMLAGDLPYAVGNLPASTLPAHTVQRSQASRQFRERIAVYWPPVPLPFTLTADESCVAAVTKRLREFGPPPYIGLTWRGGTTPSDQQGRSWMLYKEIGVSSLGAALSGLNATFVAVQRNPASGELDELQHALGRTVLDLTALNENLEKMLASMSVLDEYVTVSNTNVHLRAGINRLCRVLVPCPADWRWMESGRTSPWFPAARIYRQSPSGDWSRALAELRADLR